MIYHQNEQKKNTLINTNVFEIAKFRMIEQKNTKSNRSNESISGWLFSFELFIYLTLNNKIFPLICFCFPGFCLLFTFNTNFVRLRKNWRQNNTNNFGRIHASAYSIGSSSNGNVTPLAPEWSEWELFDSCDDECALFLNFSPKLVFGKCGFVNFEAAAELVDGSAMGRTNLLGGCDIDANGGDDEDDGNGWCIRTFDLDGCAYKCDGSKFVLMGFVERCGGDAT